MHKFRKLFILFLLFYTIGLMYLMLFGFGRTADDYKQLQLIPFKTIFSFLTIDTSFYDFFINIVCNILLFIPFGMMSLVSASFKSLKLGLMIFWIWLIPMEFIQYQTGRGVADIDDVLLNTIGFLIGFFLIQSFLSTK